MCLKRVIVVGDAVEKSKEKSDEGQEKPDLLVFHGGTFRISEQITSYVQFKHTIPFDSETVLMDGATLDQVGSVKFVQTVNDVPGYFTIKVGMCVHL